MCKHIYFEILPMTLVVLNLCYFWASLSMTFTEKNRAPGFMNRKWGYWLFDVVAVVRAPGMGSGLQVAVPLYRLLTNIWSMLGKVTTSTVLFFFSETKKDQRSYTKIWLNCLSTFYCFDKWSRLACVYWGHLILYSNHDIANYVYATMWLLQLPRIDMIKKWKKN